MVAKPTPGEYRDAVELYKLALAEREKAKTKLRDYLSAAHQSLELVGELFADGKDEAEYHKRARKLNINQEKMLKKLSAAARGIVLDSMAELATIEAEIERTRNDVRVQIYFLLNQLQKAKNKEQSLRSAGRLLGTTNLGTLILDPANAAGSGSKTVIGADPVEMIFSKPNGGIDTELLSKGHGRPSKDVLVQVASFTEAELAQWLRSSQGEHQYTVDSGVLIGKQVSLYQL